jgi:hypothetical protein
MISDYVAFVHSCISYESWGQYYWKCRCGKSGFCKTWRGANLAITNHQKEMETQMQPEISAVRKTKYIRRLFGERNGG